MSEITFFSKCYIPVNPSTDFNITPTFFLGHASMQDDPRASDSPSLLSGENLSIQSNSFEKTNL